MPDTPKYCTRLEAVHHCRWVDEVVPDAPWVIDNDFIQKHHIDYVAHDEVPYAGAGQADVYYSLKEQGMLSPRSWPSSESTNFLLIYYNRQVPSDPTHARHLHFRTA